MNGEGGPSRKTIVVLVVLGAMVLATVVLGGSSTGTPGGVADSAHGTAGRGAGAYAVLLDRFGQPVTKLGGPLKGKLEPGSTVLLLGGEPLVREDEDALVEFVRGGGRLVVAGRRGAPRLLSRLLERPPTWAPKRLGVAEPSADDSSIDGVSLVKSAGPGSWTSPGEARPLLRSPAGDALLLRARAGAGELLLLSSPAPLENRSLAAADNALLALNLVGGRPATFVEIVHGYGTRPTGFGAVPGGWWWMLIGLGIAGLALMLAYGRRIGPPELEGRELAPARSEFAVAIGRLLDRTRERDALLEREQARGREMLARVVGAHTSEAGELEPLARQAGLDEEFAALTQHVSSREEIMALGRALAELERRRAQFRERVGGVR